MPNLLEPKSTYVVEYPHAVAKLEQQMGIFWFPHEVHVEKDVQDILVNLTEAERHAVITTLKLFTKYELIVGTEYWQKIAELFQKPACVGRMANVFSFFELNVHAPFYSKINEALGLANDDFYNAYLDDPVLRDRIAMLEKFADIGDDTQYEQWDKAAVPGFLAMLALVEGVVLYSSFAFLKHFQSQGKNKILNIVRGINFSARDENIHSESSAWLFRTFMQEQGMNIAAMSDTVVKMAQLVREHEYAIVDKIFEKGKIDGITDVQMRHFIDSRINMVLKNLGYEPLFKVDYNPIADWFYDGLNNLQVNDFFSGQGREYGRKWNEQELVW